MVVTNISTIGNKTLYAKFTEITYNITYQADGGVHSNPTTFNITDLNVTLTEASKTGYAFNGWYDNAAFTGDAVTEITSIGDKALWAKLTLITGVSEIEKGFGRIYPNPTSGIVKIEFSCNNIQKLVVSDLTGKQLILKTNLQPNETVDLSGFINGVYLITIQTNKNVFTSKIVKE